MPFAALLSEVPTVAGAVADICAQSATRFAGPPDLAVVFYSPHHADQLGPLANTLQAGLQPRTMIGCAGESLVAGERELEHAPGLCVWLAKWNDDVTAEHFHLTPHQTPDGLSLLGWPDALLDADPQQTALIVLGDPFTFPAVEAFLPTLNNDYPGIPVFGGMASGAIGPNQTALFRGAQPADVGAVGVLLRGNLRYRSVVSQGCRPIGTPFVITKGQDNLIVELGGKTPVEQLRSVYASLSPADRQLFERGPHIGLVMNEYQGSFARGDFLIRNLYGIDRATGVLAIADRIRVGQTVQFQVRDAAAADDDLRALLRTTLDGHTRPAGGLLFTCNGRGTRLFDDTDHDARVIQAEAGPLALAGFFAAGELGPIGGRNFNHGFTASMVLFEECR
jgi:small ligand-binding sensory domain FIST